jgi:hypothetical protein
LHDLKQPRATGNPVSLEGGGNRQTDGLFGSAFVCHDQVSGHGVKPAFPTFDRGIEAFQVNGNVDFLAHASVHLHAERASENIQSEKFVKNRILFLDISLKHILKLFLDHVKKIMSEMISF